MPPKVGIDKWRLASRITAIIALVVGAGLLAMYFIVSSGDTFADRIGQPINPSDAVDVEFTRLNGALTVGLGIFPSLTLDKVDATGLPVSFAYDPSTLMPVRDQGSCSCSTCVPFTLCGVLADRIAIGTDQEYRIELSPQNLISCSGAFVNCQTGSKVATQITYLAEFGIIPEEDYPYTEDDFNVCSTGAIPK